MKAQIFESISKDMFKTITPSDCHVIGGETVLMTLQLTFVTMKITDRMFDNRTDF